MQRIAIARALANRPRLLLADEPTGELDQATGAQIAALLERVNADGTALVVVTHDQDEAMSVADRIAVMNRGKVEQFDTPVSIYDRPQTLFVNGFIGTTNLLNGKVVDRAGGTATVVLDAGATLSLPASTDFVAGQPEIGRAHV